MAAEVPRAPDRQDLASLPEYALSGEVPDVRAVCGNAARTDLCGGRSARAVPTATHLLFLSVLKVAKQPFRDQECLVRQGFFALSFPRAGPSLALSKAIF